MPLNPERWTDLLLALEPSILRPGMPFIRLVRGSCSPQRRRSGCRVLSLESAPDHGRRAGGSASAWWDAYIRWLYERFDVVFAPSRLMCAY